jgi:hypothetical protein
LARDFGSTAATSSQAVSVDFPIDDSMPATIVQTNVFNDGGYGSSATPGGSRLPPGYFEFSKSVAIGLISRSLTPLFLIDWLQH